MKILQIILFLLMTSYLRSQNNFDETIISYQTNEAVNKIESINILMSSHVGGAGMRPEQWNNFLELKQTATDEELTALTNHSNGVVRSYAFWALLFLNNSNVIDIVKKHLNDDELIETLIGCDLSEQMVGDVFIQTMLQQKHNKESFQINAKQLQELDSLLIYESNNLASRFDAISRAKPTEQLYPKIRELVLKENNPNALVTLAKYQKEQDIDIIKNFIDNSEYREDKFYFTYEAMLEFPRKEYLPILERNLKATFDDIDFSVEWRVLYKVIASFKTEKSLALLKMPLNEVSDKRLRKYHIDFIFDAILEFQSAIYDDLFWELWEKEHKRTLRLYKYLLLKNPVSMYELTKMELSEGYQIQKTDFIPNLENIEDSDNYYEYLINILLANDKEFANSVIVQQIGTANAHNLPFFTSKVNKQKMFVEPLFKRLEIADNPHIYLNIIKTLIEFKDKSINKRIVEVRKNNLKMNEDWGAKALDELLFEIQIE